jgi:hypothetical protein
MSREDAEQAIKDECVDTSADEETVQCASGKCDL